jgi:enoyl-CoA hydratase/carnithine racemase
LTDWQRITVGIESGVAKVTLSRADKMNAVDDAMHAELCAVWDELAADLTVRAIVLTGAGRAFCAGGDNSTFPFGEDPDHVRRRRMRTVRRIVDTMIGCEIPVVAAVNGPAVGLGATLVSLCDMAVMAEGAFLSDPHVSVGIVAGDGNAVTWPLMMGLMRAKEFLYLSERITASQACELGLVNRVVPTDKVVSTAVEIATRLASQPTQALQQTKRLVNAHLRASAAVMMDLATAAETESFLGLRPPGDS